MYLDRKGGDNPYSNSHVGQLPEYNPMAGMPDEISLAKGDSVTTTTTT
jgi:hypothetical protein